MTHERRRVSSGAPWEARVGYCRAVAAGPHVYVSGTAPVAPDGSTFAPGDPVAQTRRCIEIIAAALADLGGDLSHVVRTRMFVTDIALNAEFGKAHAEAFGGHPPASTMVEIRALVDPAMLIEIEADALLPQTS